MGLGPIRLCPRRVHRFLSANQDVCLPETNFAVLSHVSAERNGFTKIKAHVKTHIFFYFSFVQHFHFI
jgi:hypothetical protein